MTNLFLHAADVVGLSKNPTLASTVINQSLEIYIAIVVAAAVLRRGVNNRWPAKVKVFRSPLNLPSIVHCCTLLQCERFSNRMHGRNLGKKVDPLLIKELFMFLELQIWLISTSGFVGTSPCNGKCRRFANICKICVSLFHLINEKKELRKFWRT